MQVEVPPSGSLVVGRSGADLDLRTDRRVSRTHARFSLAHGTVSVEDLGSSNGTIVRATRIQGPTPLVAGSAIGVGDSALVLLRLEPGFAGSDGIRLALRDRDGSIRPLPERDELVIGRDPQHADVAVAAQTVSRVHCTVRRNGASVEIEDLGSRRGTFVEGELVAPGTRRTLSEGQRVQLGDGGIELLVDHAWAPDVGATRLAIRARREDDLRAWNLEIDAPAGATTGEVVSALAGYLGAPDRLDAGGTDGHWLAYRAADGVLLAPDAPWARSSIRRGDLLVVGPSWNSLVEHPSTREVRVASPTDDVTGLPRTLRAPTAFKPAIPTVPEGTGLRGRGIAWRLIGGLAAVFCGVLIGLFGGRPEYLVIGSVTALAGVTSIVAGIFGEQSRRKYGTKQFRQQMQELDGRLGSTCAEQAEALRQLSPPAETLINWCRVRGDRLWERRAEDGDFLSLRLGVGNRAALLDLQGSPSSQSSPLEDELSRVLDRHRVLRDVPITIDPGDSGAVVALTGTAELCEAMARSLVVQATVLHAPHDLNLVVLDPHDEWAWTAWLPHVLDAGGRDAVVRHADDRAELAARIEEALPARDRSPGAEGATARRMLLVTQAALGDPAVRSLLLQSGNAGWLALVIAVDQRSTPAGSSVVVECSRPEGRVTGMTAGPATATFTTEVLSTRAKPASRPTPSAR